MVELAGVSRRFGSTLALAPLSLRLGEGTLTVVHGPNGSGKTTLLRVLAGLLTPSTGTRRMRGTAVYLRSGDGGRRAQTVVQALGFAARTRLPHKDADAAVARAVSVAGLHEVTSARLASLSSGQRARVTLATALVVEAALLCLDEPASHLDQAGIQVLAAVVSSVRSRGAAVVVAGPTAAALFLTDLDARLLLDRGRLVEDPGT